MIPEDHGQATKPPLPGEVLLLADPYCWWPQADVRPYMGNEAYEVRIYPRERGR